LAQSLTLPLNVVDFKEYGKREAFPLSPGLSPARRGEFCPLSWQGKGLG